MNAISHHGNNINLGHYPSMSRKNKKRIRVDNLIVITQNWSKYSENSFLILLKKKYN